MLTTVLRRQPRYLQTLWIPRPEVLRPRLSTGLLLVSSIGEQFEPDHNPSLWRDNVSMSRRRAAIIAAC